MPKILDYSEEIEFLDAEILEDDDDAPVGELVVRTAAPQEEDAVVETVETIEESVATDVIPETETVEIEEDSSTAEIVDAPATEDEVATEEVAVAVEETPAEEVVAENNAIESVEETVAETPAKEEKAEETPAVKQEEKHVDIFSTSAQDEIHATNFVMPEEPKKKAPAKKAAKATETDVWGNAVISVKKEKKAEPKTETPAEETVEVKPKKSAPKKTKKENTTMTNEEENIVAKAADKEATKKAPEKEEKAPAKKETAKAAKAAEAPVATEKAAPAKKAAVKEEVKETVIVEGEGKMHGKYVIKKTDKGFFVFKLFSSNHRVVAIGSQAYKDLKSCKGGIQSVINNAEKAPVENQTLKSYEEQKCPKWVIYQDKKGEYRLRLIASNGNIVATTNDGYVDVSGAKNGIAAVARASKGCAIVRNDDLW